MKRLFIIGLLLLSSIVLAQTMTDAPGGKETTLPSDSLVFIVEWYDAGSGETGYMLLDDLIGLTAGNGLIKSGGVLAINPSATGGLSVASDALKINLGSGSLPPHDEGR